MKTDARVRYTKKVLRESLLRIMEHKSIKEITVKEVCADAQLNRATFYKHYRDCYDLLEQIENELIAEYEASFRQLVSFDVTAPVTAIFDLIDKNMDLCRLLFFNNAYGAIIPKLIAIAHNSCINYWHEHLTKASPGEVELLFTCMANGLMHIVLECYQTYDRAELIAFVNTTLKNSVSAYM